MPSINLMATGQEGVMDASWIQMASIVVEAILLVLNVVDVKIKVNESVIQKTAKTVVSILEKSQKLQESLELLEKAFKIGSTYDKAIEIFHLIQACYDDDILWTIIESLCSDMTTWDWVKTVATTVASIVAASIVAGETGGAAFVAKIVLALDSAYEFVKKFDNLSKLKAM